MTPEQRQTLESLTVCLLDRVEADAVRAALSEIDRLKRDNAEVLALLAESKREHKIDRGDECITRWTDRSPCDCGAAAWNARVDAALKVAT